jgi:uncharacterized NAD(P)/FAD-binding protein YdhS
MTRVVIAGGGASGALVAANLLRLGGPDLEIVVVEPREELGLGVAYSTTDPWHMLNVPVAGMSALDDDLGHLGRWANAAPEAFLSRVEYGRYLREVLREAQADSPATMRHVRSTAERVARDGPRVRVTLASGEEVEGDWLVLATGVELPPRLDYLDALAGDPRVFSDPWMAGALDHVVDGDAVAIIGASLTAIDVTGTILNAHPRARVVALSRHGNLPEPHEDPWRPRHAEPAFTFDEFFSWESPFDSAVARIQSFGDDWRRAVDSLRPISQQIWIALDEPQRAEFLRSYRNQWDTHRHRVAPTVAADLARWLEEGRFAVSAAHIERVESVAGGARLRIVAREGEWVVDHIVVAIGPDADAMASPLLGAAIRDGLMRPGSQGISIDVDPATGRVLDADGATTLPAFAMGALRKGALWETLAIPEIRAQAADVARRLLFPPEST